MAENKAKAGCGYAFMAVVIAGGLALIGIGRMDAEPHELVGRRILTAFGAVVTVGGILFWFPMQRALARQRAQEKLESDHPGQPWKWRPDWNTGRIEAAGGKAAAAMWFFAIFWNAISWGSVFAAWRQIAAGEKAVWLVFLFPFVGLFLVWAALYQTIKARKFGRPVFLPTSVPGVVGGYLGGVIHIPAALRPENALSLSLQALRTTVHGTGKNRSVQTAMLWENEVRLAPESFAAGRTGSDVPVLFHIPAGQPDSDLKTSDPRTYWRLRARAAVPGVDFAADFEVPVFATGETVAPPAPDQPLLPEYRQETLTPQALAEAGIAISPAGRGGHPVWHFTTRHLLGTKLTIGVLALGFSAGVIALVLAGLWLPALFVGFFDLIFLLLAHSLWSGETEIEIGPNDVVIRTKKAGGWKEQRVPRDQIALIRQDNSMKSGEKQYYKLVLVGTAGADAVHTADGEPFALRKARYQLRVAQKKAGTGAADETRTAELLASVRSQPRFQITAATHVPGPALAERIARTLEQQIRK
jgi:hypothetical protein